MACVGRLSPTQRAGQLVWPAVQGDQLARRTQQFADWGVGGAVLMTWPATATPAALQALKTAGAVPLLIATDEEGGTVQRMKSLGVIPAAATVARRSTPAQAEQMIADTRQGRAGRRRRHRLRPGGRRVPGERHRPDR